MVHLFEVKFNHVDFKMPNETNILQLEGFRQSDIPTLKSRHISNPQPAHLGRND
jgi:hypothetical protein